MSNLSPTEARELKGLLEKAELGSYMANTEQVRMAQLMRKATQDSSGGRPSHGW